MTHMSEDDFGSILDEEEVSIDVRRPVGGVVSVRFNGEEMRRLRSEVNRTDEKVSSFIKKAVFMYIASRRGRRDHPLHIGLTVFGPWKGYVARGFVSESQTLAHTAEIKGWPSKTGSQHPPV